MILGIQARSSWGGPCENAVHRLHNYIILYVYNMSYMYIIFNMCTLLYEYLATSTLYYIYIYIHCTYYTHIWICIYALALHISFYFQYH